MNFIGDKNLSLLCLLLVQVLQSLCYLAHQLPLLLLRRADKCGEFPFVPRDTEEVLEVGEIFHVLAETASGKGDLVMHLLLVLVLVSEEDEVCEEVHQDTFDLVVHQDVHSLLADEFPASTNQGDREILLQF